LRDRIAFRATEGPILNNAILLRLHPAQLHHPPALTLGCSQYRLSYFSVAVIQRCVRTRFGVLPDPLVSIHIIRINAFALSWRTDSELFTTLKFTPKAV
jgi:hypothetical protein